MGRYLITGATRGIGRAVLDLLAGQSAVVDAGTRASGGSIGGYGVAEQAGGWIGGHELIAVGRSSAALRELPVAHRVVADLADPAGLEAAVPAFDRLDGVVHCAGVARRGDLQSSSVAEWHRQLALNVIAPAELTRLLLPALRAGRGTVVFVNSGQGLAAAANSTIYASTKFALRALADSLRAGEPSLRVSSIFPGRVATDMQRALREQEDGPYEPSSYLQPSTVAAAIVSALTAPPDAVVADVTLRPARP